MATAACLRQRTYPVSQPAPSASLATHAFAARHIGPSESDIAAMLTTVGAASLEECWTGDPSRPSSFS